MDHASNSAIQEVHNRDLGYLKYFLYLIRALLQSFSVNKQAAGLHAMIT
jgi:hypothetical protein